LLKEENYNRIKLDCIFLQEDMLKIIGSEAMGNHIVKKIQDKKKGLTNNENVKKKWNYVFYIEAQLIYFIS